MSNDEQNKSTSDAISDIDASEIPNSEEKLGESFWEDEGLEEDYLEEEVPDESEESFKTQYQVDNKSNAVAAIGDNAQVTIYNYIQIISESRKSASSEDDGDIAKEDIVKSKYELIEKALKLERQSGTFPANTAFRSEVLEMHFSTSEDGISQWYYELDEYEQCYVQAVAILHGASAREISQRADSLYMHFTRQERHHEEAIPQGMKPPQQNISSPSMSPLRSGSSRELQKRTRTITRRIEGIERLFWQDVDIYGLSTFEFHLLDFLAVEFMNKGMHGQNLLEMIRQWSQESEKEYSWLSARALGVFLWRQDVDGLRRRANEWAKNYSLRSWRRAAMLLDGAYEIDYLKYPEKGSDPKAMPVLQLLNEWVNRGQQAPRSTDIYVKCAAANTYGLIGKRKLGVALDGLDRLLRFTHSESMPDINKLFAAIVAAYVSLSWSRHIRDVLAHLARVAEEAVLQPSNYPRLSDRNSYRQQCEARLDVALKAFFLIAADSLSEAGASNSAAYRKSLPIPPSLPDPLGRDVVLTGLLQNLHGWRQQIITLLCAAIIDRSRNSRATAFDLIRTWAEVLLEMPEEADGDGKKTQLTSFTCFMVGIGKTINSWCRHLEKRGKRTPPADIIYKKQLEQWHRGKHVIAPLARDVFYQLSHK